MPSPVIVHVNISSTDLLAYTEPSVANDLTLRLFGCQPNEKVRKLYARWMVERFKLNALSHRSKTVFRQSLKTAGLSILKSLDIDF